MVGFSESDRSAIAFAQRFQRCVMGHVEVQRRHAAEAVLHRLHIGMVSGGGNRLDKAEPVITMTAGDRALDDQKPVLFPQTLIHKYHDSQLRGQLRRKLYVPMPPT